MFRCVGFGEDVDICSMIYYYFSPFFILTFSIHTCMLVQFIALVNSLVVTDPSSRVLTDTDIHFGWFSEIP